MTPEFDCITFTNGETDMQRDLTEGIDSILFVWSCRVRPQHIIPLPVLHHCLDTVTQGIFLKPQ